MADSYSSRIWSLAADMLGSRALVAKLVKTYGEASVMSMVGGIASMRNPPADCRAYLTAALASKLREQGKGPMPQPPMFQSEKPPPPARLKEERAQRNERGAAAVAAIRGKLGR